ncbi:MAG: tetratricopeptide repeat protein [Gammaproteobacteria bacterium]
MRWSQATTVLVLVATLTACAGGGGTRAPVEERSSGSSSDPPAASRAAPSAAPAVASERNGDGVVVEALPDTPRPRVEALAEDAAPGDDAETPTQLAHVAPETSQARGGAAQSLLAAAVKAAGAGEWDRAQAALERAVRLSPQDAELWRQLAYTHYREGDLEQAAAHAQRAVALAPDAVEGWQLVADIESARGNAEAAARARTRAAAP